MTACVHARASTRKGLERPLRARGFNVLQFHLLTLNQNRLPFKQRCLKGPAARRYACVDDAIPMHAERQAAADVSCAKPRLRHHQRQSAPIR
jgi:hypothetical protein